MVSNSILRAMTEKRTGVTFPIEVVLGVAVTLVVQSDLLTGRAVGERNMVVCDVVEEVDLVLLQEKRSSDRVNGSISPAFVEESAVFVESIKVICVSLGTKPIKITDFKVGPLEPVSRWHETRGSYLPCGNGCKFLRHRH